VGRKGDKTHMDILQELEEFRLSHIFHDNLKPKE